MRICEIPFINRVLFINYDIPAESPPTAKKRISIRLELTPSALKEQKYRETLKTLFGDRLSGKIPESESGKNPLIEEEARNFFDKIFPDPKNQEAIIDGKRVRVSESMNPYR